jgi:hypothetical protein
MMKRRWYYKMPRQRRTRLAIGIIAGLLGFACWHAARAGDDWIPVPPEDLALKDNPASPGADAMILYRESVVNATESSVAEYVRIKVFTQKGVEEGDLEIPFQTGQSDIRGLRARTIQPDGKIENFEGKPYDKMVAKAGGLRVMAKVVTLPHVTPGCILEYKYKEQFDPNFYISLGWTVQGRKFTRYARFSIIPAKLPGAPPLLLRQYGLPKGTAPQKQPNGSYGLEIKDLPGIEVEDFMPPEESLEARVEFFYRNPSDPTDLSVEKYWNRIGKGLSTNLDEFTKKKGALDAELEKVVSPNDPPEVKLRKIFDRAQQIRDLSMEASKTEKEAKKENLKPNTNVEDVLKHGYGNGRDINYFFIGLAREAGFEASEVYLRSRTRGVWIPGEEDTKELDADIVWVRAGGKDYYLDPAATYFPFGILPWDEAGTIGLRVKKDGGDIAETPKAPSSDGTVVRHVDLTIDEEGAATGKLRVDFTGQRGALRREEDRNEDETGRKKSLEEEIEGWFPAGSTLEITSVTGWEKISEPLRVEGTVKIASFGTTAGRRMLSPLTPFQAMQAKSFSSARRSNPIYFNFPYEELDEIVLHAPAGYKLETPPPAKHMQPGALSYDISVAPQGDSVVVTRHLVVQAIQIALGSYGALRQFFISVKSNDEAQVVYQNAANAKNN